MADFLTRIVLRYGISDGYTYFSEIVRPVEYSSPEALLVDFMAAAREALDAKRSEFSFLGESHPTESFFTRLSSEQLAYWNVPDRRHKLVEAHGTTYLVNDPDVLTLDEWFTRYGLRAVPKSA